MEFRIQKEDFDEVVEFLRKNPQELFQIDFARYRVGHRRYLEAKKSLKISDDNDGLWSDALAHNVRGLDKFGSPHRTNRLIRPLCAIDRVFFGAANLKALCVGPRTEMELFSLVAQGFQIDNIRGLDLFSYSPWIDVGNMHNMPYPDSSFDVVIAGWVLVYSADPERACREFLRVAADGGIIAIGATVPDKAVRAAEDTGRSAMHYPSADDLLKIFGASVRNVYVRHESESDESEGRTILIFDVRK